MLGRVSLLVPCVQPLAGCQVVVSMHELVAVGAGPVVDLEAILIVEVSVGAPVAESPLLGYYLDCSIRERN